MDLKPKDIFNGNLDSSIWFEELSYGLGKLNLDNQHIESAPLSVENNKVNETTNSFKDTKNQDLKMSVTNVQTVVEEQAQETELEKRDINGNEESSSDENIIQLFDELELSDTDNEAVDDEDNEAVEEEDIKAVDEEDNEAVDDEDNEAVREEGSGLIERGPVPRQVTKRRNRTNHLQRDERYDRSQIPPRSLAFWSGSTVQSFDTPLMVSNPILNISEINLTSFNNDSLSSQGPVVYEDLIPNAFGSPESGYDSSITGSPPQNSSDSISETDDTFDWNNLGNAESTTDDKAHKEIRVKKIYYFLKDELPLDELNEPSNELPLDELNEPSNACSNKDCVPSVNSNNNACSVNSSPCLRRHVENHKRIDYKLENKARTALYQFLSDAEYKSTQERIYRQIADDKAYGREIKIIQVVDEVDGTCENRTNLHHAVINSNIEEIFCLVEIQKQYKKPLFDINIRDKHGKTALDYAVKNNMTYVVDYLEENTACPGVNI